MKKQPEPIYSAPLNGFKLQAFIVALAFMVSGMVYAEPTTSTVFKYYDIFPASNAELNREMLKRSPIKKNGRTFKGHTHWKVNWHFKWQRRNGICRITKVNTTLSVTYTMPRIAEGYRVTQPVRRSFNSYFASLLKHEKNHMKSGLYAARDIEYALLNLGAFASCEQLDATANATGKRIIQQYNKRDREYDKKTDHGRTEGVNIDNFI